MTIGTDDLGRITQQTKVVSSDGDRLGSINQVYTSDTTGDPAWVTVKTGLFGAQESFVPLSDASFDGEDIRVGVTKDAVHGAPRVDSDGHLTPEEEDELYRHYGLHNPDQGVGHGDRGDRLDDDRVGDDRGDDDQVGDRDDDRDVDRATPRHAAPGDTDDRSVAAENGPEHVADAGTGAGAGAGTGAAAGAGPGRRDDEDVSDDREGGQEAYRPGERTTRLRRYVVTERVVQTVEELPDEDGPSR
jgi:hypothetical protein